VPAAASYRVYRTSNNSIYALVGNPSGSSFTDAVASVNVAYLYKVVAVDPGSGVSPDSGKVLVTTVAFTDPTLTSGASAIKAVHITQLRTAVNLVRALGGLGAATFTDPVLSTSTQIKRVHLTQLRSELDTMRSTLGVSALTYTDSTITAGVTGVKGVHIRELREGVGAKLVVPPILSQLLLNPGFESGNVDWTTTSGVISNSGPPPRTGSWFAWMNGYGETHIDTVEQQVTIPAAATSATLSFWVLIETDEGPGEAFDYLRIQILDAGGAFLETLAAYSNLDANVSYVQKTFDLTQYAGQTIKIRFYGDEDSILATSFVIDDTALDVSQPGS
jgi:hypothetical protein